MNQYVKPTDRHRRAEFPMPGKTIYSTEFVLKRRPVPENVREADHFKTGLDWMGDTTYHKSFKEINPEDVAMPNSFKPA